MNLRHTNRRDDRNSTLSLQAFSAVRDEVVSAFRIHLSGTLSGYLQSFWIVQG